MEDLSLIEERVLCQKTVLQVQGCLYFTPKFRLFFFQRFMQVFTFSHCLVAGINLDYNEGSSSSMQIIAKVNRSYNSQNYHSVMR